MRAQAPASVRARSPSAVRRTGAGEVADDPPIAGAGRAGQAPTQCPLAWRSRCRAAPAPLRKARAHRRARAGRGSQAQVRIAQTRAQLRSRESLPA
eukprot:scaffold146960_cov30-Tisochrysis_lutea.AAC.2